MKMQRLRFACVALSLTPLAAQSLPDAANQLSFDVASIKPSDALKSAGVASGWSFSYTPTGLKTIGSLQTFIKKAYDVEDNQISGGPAWLDRDIYEIDAKASAPVSLDDLKRMLQSLLADRFQLAMHRETRQLTVYSLVLAKGGSKLQKPDDAGNGFSSGANFLRGTMETAALAGHLTSTLGRTVVDNTGLKGSWKFSLTWTADDGTTGPSIFTAIQEQLGLRLVSTKGLVSVLVIDRAAQPSDN
jgi:uncharacterized protein (TIGR03435 family)